MILVRVGRVAGKKDCSSPIGLVKAHPNQEDVIYLFHVALSSYSSDRTPLFNVMDFSFSQKIFQRNFFYHLAIL